MDYFNDVRTIFLGLEHGGYVAVSAGSESSDLIKNIFICVPKMNNSLTGLERHEGEQLMTIFIFVWAIPLMFTASNNAWWEWIRQSVNAPCWYCNTYPFRTPFGWVGGVQCSVISVSDGLSSSKDEGEPGTGKHGWQDLNPSHFFIYFNYLSLSLSFLPPSGVLKVRGSDWGPSPLLLMTLTDSA